MPDATPQRRLAAIVSTDVVGYSRLMEADEADTLARMKGYRQELWGPLIDRHGGRIVGTAGDALLVEYSSAVSAVESAIAVQEEMAAREAAEPDERKMLLRVGVNIGEVVVDGDDIYGDGVNVAARLQALAPPGGVCISGKVHDEIEGKLAAAFADAGEQQVKNIARPVRVWQWSTAEPVADADAPAGPNAGRPLPDKPSIAVLPFDNMSVDPEQEFFADGITEDVITELSGTSASATSSKAACAWRRTGSASPPSSSTRYPAATCGPTATTAISPISSRSRTRSPTAWSGRSRRRCWSPRTPARGASRRRA
jgi:adenylate cyclase